MDQLISQTTLHLILDLRLLIARAGERDSLAWWNSHTLTEQGQWVLSRLVPRHAAYAGVRLALEATAVMHREAIGQRPAVTLFGLGADLDARVMRQLELHRNGAGGPAPAGAGRGRTTGGGLRHRPLGDSAAAGGYAHSTGGLCWRRDSPSRR